LAGRNTEDVRLFADSCLNKNLKLRAECKGLLVQQFVTKYEVLTPNYLGRWLNRKEDGNRQSSIVAVDSVGEDAANTSVESPNHHL